jgi:hypothetical protein
MRPPELVVTNEDSVVDDASSSADEMIFLVVTFLFIIFLPMQTSLFVFRLRLPTSVC